MWVCLCKGVTDTVIRQAVSDGARTTFEVGAACRAGTGCGGCLPEVRRIVWSEVGRQLDAGGDAAAAALAAV